MLFYELQTKKRLFTQRKPPHLKARCRLPSPSLVDLRVAQDRQFSWLGILARLRLPKGSASVTVPDCSVQLCSSVQWRDRFGVGPNSLLSPCGHLSHLCNSYFIGVIIMVLSFFVN